MPAVAFQIVESVEVWFVKLKVEAVPNAMSPGQVELRGLQYVHVCAEVGEMKESAPSAKTSEVVNIIEIVN